MLRILFVGGTFNNNGGRASGYVNKVLDQLAHYLPNISVTVWNGGFYRSLKTLDVTGYDVIFWWPNIPNSEEKLLGRIKTENSTCVLVISKVNNQHKYNIATLCQRMLAVKANLLVEFDTEPERIIARILDPLANRWGVRQLRPGSKESLMFFEDVGTLVYALVCRIQQLMKCTRVRSVQSTHPHPGHSSFEETRFLELVHKSAERFAEIIYGGMGIDRFVGNASFRCAKSMPSYRNGDHIWVSARNIDKSHITLEDFVPARLADDGSVEYWGDRKPSVDTPMQLRLYQLCPYINYMIHSHTYVEEGLIVSGRPLPCGAIEEFDAIRSRLGPRADGLPHFAVNLPGHGSIVAGFGTWEPDHYRYFGRSVPEFQLVD